MRLDFVIPDYLGDLPGHLEGGLRAKIALTLAQAHAREVEDAAKEGAPVRTGRLQRSIRAYAVDAARGVLEASAPYAGYLHDGTGVYGPAQKPIVIEPRGKRALFWPGAAHPVKRVLQRGIKPRDFLRQSVKRHFESVRALKCEMLFTLAVFDCGMRFPYDEELRNECNEKAKRGRKICEETGEYPDQY